MPGFVELHLPQQLGLTVYSLAVILRGFGGPALRKAGDLPQPPRNLRHMPVRARQNLPLTVGFSTGLRGAHLQPEPTFRGNPTSPVSRFSQPRT